jgi:hypothetical protein
MQFPVALVAFWLVRVFLGRANQQRLDELARLDQATKLLLAEKEQRIAERDARIGELKLEVRELKDKLTRRKPKPDEGEKGSES